MPSGGLGDTPLSGALGAYAHDIDAYTEVALRPYLDRIKGREALRGSKEFNDTVWGTVTLQPHEVVVLDSPLLQRLRRIRQLGVVHFVYPGANHTRFEHSLGVCHQVSELANSINIHGDGQKGAEGALLTDKWVDTLRLAGLCHDIGHGVMSHVIENALKDDIECDDLLISFQRYLNKPSKPQLSEMAAYFMMRSHAMAELLEAACNMSSTKKYDASLPSNIARIIVGKSVDSKLPLLHELISGPFDADKLDYMPRDARMCGVPVVTDVVRLIQKLRAVTVPSHKLPTELQDGIQHENSGHLVLGIARSGASALDEVSLGRALMFDKIYRHHKVRAVEAMVASVIAEVGSLIESRLPMLPLAISDEEFLDLDLPKLRSLAGKSYAAAPLEVAADILCRLRDRRLYARCFAFAQTMPFDAYRNDDDQRFANERFIRDMTDEQETREEFVVEVIRQVEMIAAKVGRESDLDEYPHRRLDSYIRVDPPTSSGRGSEADQSRAYLVDEAANLSKVEKVRSENRGWSDAYINAKDVGFIFAPTEIADMVHIAAEVAARVTYDLRMPRQMQAYAKLGGDKVEDLRRTLASAGFYSNLPRDLAPEPDLFKLVQTQHKLTEIATKLSGYMGPTDISAPQFVSPSLNEDRIRDWVVQYPDDCMEMALDVARGVRMLSRDGTISALKAFIDKHQDFSPASVVPLGDPKDGASIVGYHVGDITKSLGCELRSRDSALAQDDLPIIFVDDIVGRGSSSISIFEAMLGYSPTTKLNEERQYNLTESQIERLKSKKIAVVFTVGLIDGEQNLRERLKELGLDAVVYVHDYDIPTVQDVLTREGHDASAIAKFQETSKTIGMALLQSEGPDDRAPERAFGYGNEGRLLVSSYNTPTITLTTLWKTGKVDGVAWRALLPRRKKT